MATNPSETTMQNGSAQNGEDNRRIEQGIGSRSVRYWSSSYIQHSAHIPPGRDGLFNLIRSTAPTLKYEPGVIVAENDCVIVHGGVSGTGRPRSWIAADVVRVTDGVLAEHWDILQDEATEAESQSGLPIFGTRFPGERS
jgi:predicted SnoaL-like aldol condensation-catalyzing enzyme